MSRVTLERIAADLGIHPMTLSKWRCVADVEDGVDGVKDRRGAPGSWPKCGRR